MTIIPLHPLFLAPLQISGSVQLDSGAAVALLAPGGPGLRPFRVPQHLAWVCDDRPGLHWLLAVRHVSLLALLLCHPQHIPQLA
jgi:hypothetical protein